MPDKFRKILFENVGNDFFVLATDEEMYWLPRRSIHYVGRHILAAIHWIITAVWNCSEASWSQPENKTYTIQSVGFVSAEKLCESQVAAFTAGDIVWETVVIMSRQVRVIIIVKLNIIKSKCVLHISFYIASSLNGLCKLCSNSPGCCNTAVITVLRDLSWKPLELFLA